MPFWRFCVTGNNKNLLDCHVEYCRTISTKLGISLQFPESRFRPVETVLTQENLGQIDRRSDDKQTDMTKIADCFRNYATALETSIFQMFYDGKISSPYFEKITFQRTTSGTMWNQKVGQNIRNL